MLTGLIEIFCDLCGEFNMRCVSMKQTGIGSPLTAAASISSVSSPVLNVNQTINMHGAADINNTHNNVNSIKRQKINSKELVYTIPYEINSNGDYSTHGATKYTQEPTIKLRNSGAQFDTFSLDNLSILVIDND